MTGTIAWTPPVPHTPDAVDQSEYVWVVKHGTRKFYDASGNASAMYLGQFGWKGRIIEAQQFQCKADAETAMRMGERDVPIMWLNAKAEAIRVPKPTPGAGSMQHDYEPFEGLNG